MNRKKILIVDDSRTSLFLETTILRTAGDYDLISAVDGEEAVSKAVAQRPDLIVMDVVMPRKSGLEACSELRALQPTSAIPVILVTTRGEPESVERGFESGCCDYVTKPVDAEELIAKVRAWIGQ